MKERTNKRKSKREVNKKGSVSNDVRRMVIMRDGTRVAKENAGG